MARKELRLERQSVALLCDQESAHSLLGQRRGIGDFDPSMSDFHWLLRAIRKTLLEAIRRPITAPIRIWAMKALGETRSGVPRVLRL
jgi:hypothetical protein